MYSLGSLCTSLTSHLDHQHGGEIDDGAARAFALGLRLIGKFFESLPSEVLEDEIPRRAQLIKRVRPAYTCILYLLALPVLGSLAHSAALTISI